jgi:hypothetical protein
MCLDGLRKTTKYSTAIRSVDPQLNTEFSNMAKICEVLDVFRYI